MAPGRPFPVTSNALEVFATGSRQEPWRPPRGVRGWSMRIRSLSFISVVLLLGIVAEAPAQKKPEPPKPASQPAPPAPVPVDPRLESERDAIAKATSAKLNAVEGRSFDFISTLTAGQVT